VSMLRAALLEASMPRLREIVATSLASVLLSAPLYGFPAADALGTVVAANGASVSGTGAAVGTTIFSGDKLSTADDGSVQLRAGAARFLLSKSSIATIGEDSGTPVATLLRGSATFSTAAAKAFSLIASTAVIRPKSDEPTIGQVTLLDAKQLLVQCTRGALTITVAGDSRVIPEGSAYRVVLDPSEEAQQQPPPEGAGTKGSGRPPISAGTSKFVWYAIGATALVTAIVIYEACESPDRP
jgi:hypothetical protein